MPFPFTDVGADGIVQARATTSTVTLLGMPNIAQAGTRSRHQLGRDEPPDDAYGRFKTVEASVTKRYGNRWSGQIGFGYTWTTHFPQKDTRRTRIRPASMTATGWGFKATGTYDMARGALDYRPFLRHQSGVQFARQISGAGQRGRRHLALTLPATTYYAEAPAPAGGQHLGLRRSR